jgi:L-ascorbate metabolism protein UlaG (beta-lactamase superfamily)
VSARLVETPFAETLATRLRSSPTAECEFYWLGQAGFVIEGAGRRIAIDPYLSNTLAAKYAGSAYSHERMTPPPVEPYELGEVDFVFCTHHHTDHMDPGTLQPLARRLPNVRFIVPAASLALARERTGAADSQLIGLDARDSLDLCQGVSVRATRAAHETIERDERGRCRYLGYVINCGGAKIFHSGDCAPFDGFVDEISALTPDVALMPVNGRSEELRQAGFAGNFTLDESLALCGACGIPNLICHHYGTFAFNTVDPAAIDAAAGTTPFVAVRARPQVAYSLILG